MIKTLIINNFQSWKETQINFHQGVNVLIGNSDEGKSAVLRSIYWAAFNHPRGDAFRSWWGGDTSSTLICEDTPEVKRIRSSKLNQYEIQGYKDPLKAVGGGDAPEEVTQELRMDRDINVQAQADPIFLLSKSPGEVARHFNKVAGLFRITSTLKNGKADITQTKSAIAAFEETLEAKQAKILKYAFLDSLDVDITNLEEKEKECKTSISKKQELKDLIRNLESAQNTIQVKQKKLKVQPLVLDVLKRKEQKSKYFRLKGKIQYQIDNIVDNGAELQQNQRKYKIKPLVDSCVKKKTGVQKLKRDLKVLRTFLNTIEKSSYKIKKLKMNRKQYKETLKKEMPEICPLCKTKLK